MRRDAAYVLQTLNMKTSNPANIISPATRRTAQNGMERSVETSQGMSDDHDSPWKMPSTIRSNDIRAMPIAESQ